MTQESTKNDGAMAFIATLLKKSAAIPGDIFFLSNSVQVLAERIIDFGKRFTRLVKVVNDHTEKIEKLSRTQTALLNNILAQQTTDFTKLKSSPKKIDKPN
jgi:hypothetical protein